MFLFFGTLYLQQVLKSGSLQAGMGFVPIAVVIALVSLGLSTPLITRFGQRAMLLLGLALIVGAFVRSRSASASAGPGPSTSRSTRPPPSTRSSLLNRRSAESGCAWWREADAPRSRRCARNRLQRPPEPRASVQRYDGCSPGPTGRSGRQPGRGVGLPRGHLGLDWA